MGDTPHTLVNWVNPIWNQTYNNDEPSKEQSYSKKQIRQYWKRVKIKRGVHLFRGSERDRTSRGLTTSLPLKCYSESVDEQSKNQTRPKILFQLSMTSKAYFLNAYILIGIANISLCFSQVRTISSQYFFPNLFSPTPTQWRRRGIYRGKLGFEMGGKWMKFE